MTVDVGFAQERVRTERLSPYYGFDPEQEYTLRSRSRRYNGITYGRYRFVNGECIAPRMRAEASEEQKWARGERLSWFAGNRGYAVYRRGEQPAPDVEPMWMGQEPPEEELIDDTGEEPVRWTAAESYRSATAEEGLTHYPAVASGDSGESDPTPERTITRFRGVSGETDGEESPGA